MKFSYTAVGNATERTSATTIDAADATEAMDTLRRQGVFVSEIAQASDAAVKASDPTKGKISRGKRLKHLVNFTRQNRVLVASGTPLVQALIALERQALDKQWRGVLERIRTRWKKALRCRPRWRSSRNTLIRSAAAWCRPANRAASSNQCSIVSRNSCENNCRSATRSAARWSIRTLLIFIAVGVMVVMLTFVLPRFAGLFQTLDTPLPPTTKMVMWMSDAVRAYWWAILIGARRRWRGDEVLARLAVGQGRI